MTFGFSNVVMASTVPAMNPYSLQTQQPALSRRETCERINSHKKQRKKNKAFVRVSIILYIIVIFFLFVSLWFSLMTSRSMIAE